MKDFMTQNRRERKKEATSIKIVNIAIDLFHKNGADVTTMEQIAETADIAKGTLYNYFPEKGAIISQYWRQKISELARDLPLYIKKYESTQKRLFAFLKVVLEFMAEEVDLYRIYAVYRVKNLTSNNLCTSLRSGLDGLLAALLIQGQKDGDIRKDIPINILASNLENAFIQVCFIWQNDPGNFEIEIYLKTIVKLFLEGANGNKK